MKEVILSVLFNVGVGVLLKLFNQKTKSPKLLFQVITYNYIFSAIFCYFIYKPDLTNLDYSKAPWLVYTLMSILMPTVFILIGKTINLVGIARADIAQRLSLLITVLAAFLFFKEDFNSFKIAGLALGFVSIFFIFSIQKNSKTTPQHWYLPLSIFFGLGIINILYKLIASNPDFSFTTSTLFIFIGSFVVGSIMLLTQKQKFSLKALYWGLGVGILNFGNVLFYLLAHQALKDNPSIVFATMNLGVIIIGSIVGVVFFKEKMTPKNYFGIMLALIAILVITLT